MKELSGCLKQIQLFSSLSSILLGLVQSVLFQIVLYYLLVANNMIGPLYYWYLGFTIIGQLISIILILIASVTAYMAGAVDSGKI